MKLKFFICLVFTLSFCVVKAQKVHFSLGPEINFPSGNSSNISSIGIGVYVKGELAIADKFAFTTMASLNTFYGRKVLTNVNATNLSYAPIRLGFKYYPTEGFYLEGQAGASFSVKNDYKTTFIWAPGIGTFLDTKGGNRFDIGLRYESQKNSVQYTLVSGSLTNFGYIGLRAGYVF